MRSYAWVVGARVVCDHACCLRGQAVCASNERAACLGRRLTRQGGLNLPLPRIARASLSGKRPSGDQFVHSNEQAACLGRRLTRQGGLNLPLPRIARASLSGRRPSGDQLERSSEQAACLGRRLTRALF